MYNSMTSGNTTQSLSLSLYHFMCQNIVGYEDHVNTIRKMNNVRDSLSNADELASITSGSFGEGIEMKGSDIDIMSVVKAIAVHEDISSVVCLENKAYFSLNMEDTKPGFTYIFPQYHNGFNILPMCEVVRGKHFLSNTLFKQKFAHKYIPVDHGPCLSDKNGYVDYAFCVHSKSWITPANQWITRPNNSWPSVYVKHIIVDHGVLFVPIGVKGSSNEAVEWRLSFSVGEKLLIYTFSHTQLLCYALLKIVLKDVISIDKRCKDLLCSYFLKTIILWVSEEIQQSVWTPDNLILCFMRCFRRLMYCVNYSVCPHYFIPENNLFENKIEGVERKLLLNNLNTLYKYDWRFILFSTQIYQFDISHHKYMPFVAYTYSIENILLSSSLALLNVFYFEKCSNTSDIIYTRAIRYLNRFRSNRIRRMYLYYTSFVCTNKSETVMRKTIYGNKNKYKQYKTCLSYLLQNIHHDSVCGWLMLASLFYRIQQYDKAMEIVLYALSKCTLEKLYYGRDLSEIHFKLLGLRTIRNMGICNLLKHLNVQFCIFCEKSSLIPTELQLEVDTETYTMPPVVYAHFLQFLCYFHLKNSIQCKACIRDLRHIITDKYFTPDNNVVRGRSCNYLGVALQLLGENESAKYAFRQSIALDPHFNTAFKRLLHLSSK